MATTTTTKKPAQKPADMSLKEAVAANAFPRKCPSGKHRLRSADEIYVVPSTGNHQCVHCRRATRKAYRAAKRAEAE